MGHGPTLRDYSRGNHRDASGDGVVYAGVSRDAVMDPPYGSFAKGLVDVVEVDDGRRCAVAGAAPASVIAVLRDEAVKGRVWPGVGTAGVLVFDGVVVDVVEMAIEIGLVTDGVLPEALLPDSVRFLTLAGSGTWLLKAAGGEIQAGELRFENGHAEREIRIAFGKGHEHVQVIGEKHDGVEREGVISAAEIEGSVEHRAGGFSGEDGRAAFGDGRKEERAAGSKCPDVVGHVWECDIWRAIWQEAVVLKSRRNRE